jgi:hypothetical protein
MKNIGNEYSLLLAIMRNYHANNYAVDNEEATYFNIIAHVSSHYIYFEQIGPIYLFLTDSLIIVLPIMLSKKCSVHDE